MSAPCAPKDRDKRGAVRLTGMFYTEQTRRSPGQQPAECFCRAPLGQSAALAGHPRQVYTGLLRLQTPAQELLVSGCEAACSESFSCSKGKCLQISLFWRSSLGLWGPG